MNPRLAAASALGLAIAAGTALAQKPIKLPATIPVYAAFVPIDDGTMHVVVLKPGHDKPAPRGSLPRFCASGWQHGWVQNAEGIKPGNAPTSALGCWSANAEDPTAAGTVTFRFFGSHAKKVREFTLAGSTLQPLSFDWRTELLHRPAH